MKQLRVAFPAKYLSLLLLVLLMVFAVSASAETGDDPLEGYSTEPVLISETLSADGQSVNIIVELPVSQDTFITSGQPDRNWGGDPNLRSGFDTVFGLNAERMLMQFNFSSIPSDAVINNATFRIFQIESIPGNDAPLGYAARFLNSSWQEFVITWNSHQPDWGSIFVTGEITNINGWKEVNATDLVRQWVSGLRPNYGFIVIANETPVQRERVFSSRERGDGNFPRMIVDYTLSTDITPPTATVNPLPPFSEENFLVTWSGEDNPGGSGIAYYDVQFQVNGGVWQNWRMTTTTTQATFTGAAEGTTIGFRARAVDNAGNVQAWSPNAQTQTFIDDIPPTSSVNPLPQCVFTPNFQVTWTGSDNINGSGIANFDLQYQLDSGQFNNWLLGTTQTSAQYTGGQNGVTYGFRVRATDNAGNVEPWSPNAEAQTTVSIDPPTTTVNPIIPPVTSNNSIPVSWSGVASPCTNITGFDVRYRRDQGSWVNWQTNTLNISAVFDVSGLPDGNYQFEARATDSMGRVEAWESVGEAFVIVRRSAPFLDFNMYLPQVFAQFAGGTSVVHPELDVDHP